MDNPSTAITGIDKASALLLTLGVDTSSKVLQYLTEGEIERVLLALGKTGPIPPEDAPNSPAGKQSSSAQPMPLYAAVRG